MTQCGISQPDPVCDTTLHFNSLIHDVVEKHLVNLVKRKLLSKEVFLKSAILVGRI